jgi:hypothetical protein
MKGTRWLLVVLLVWTLPAWADGMRKQTFVVGADVNAQGAVTQTQVDADVSKPIAAVLDLALKHWSFVSAQKEGKAVPVHTFIEVKFDATADAAGKYTLSISYVSQGPRWDRKFQPYYTPDAVRAGLEGNVAVIGELQADGTLIITDSRTTISKRASLTLTQSVKDSLLRDGYIPELLDGKPVAARMRAFVNFHINNLSHSDHPHTFMLVQGGKRVDQKGDDHRQTLDNADLDETMDDASRNFLATSGFDVGLNQDRSWRSGVSSVLQPRVVNPVTMHL